MNEVPTEVQVWIQQLLDPQFIELMRSQPFDRVDVKLSASRGKVSRAPLIVLNGGQVEWAELPFN